MEDRNRFDELVYNRPDPLRGTVPTTAPGRGDPREHDYRHSRVSFRQSLVIMLKILM